MIGPEFPGALDAEWVRAASLRTGGAGAKELERALRELPPSAFRAVRTLEQAGLLRRRHGTDALALAPTWLARRAVAIAHQRTAAGVPREWGEALLSPGAAVSTARAVFERALSGDPELFEDVLDLDDPRDPASAVAIETAFRAAGVAVLSGTEVPPEVVLGLWDSAIHLVVEGERGPGPRVEHPETVVAEEPRLGVGFFWLAALALSELLPPERGARHPVLRPWGSTGSNLGPTLDRIGETLASVDVASAAWARETFSLVDRLRRSFDLDGALHPMQWPGATLAAIDRDDLDWRAVRTATPGDLGVLLAVAAHRGISRRAVVDALWHAWARSPEPIEERSLFSPSAPTAPVVFEHVPRSALAVLFERRLVSLERLPYASFEEATFRTLLELAPGAISRIRDLWEALPLSLFAEALRTADLDDIDLTVLWRRAPDALLTALQKARGPDEARALRMVRSAPTSETERIVALLVEWNEKSVSRPSALARRSLRDWLRDRVRERAMGWRSAFDLSCRLDQI
jgi:hypothetical protein